MPGIFVYAKLLPFTRLRPCLLAKDDCFRPCLRLCPWPTASVPPEISLGRTSKEAYLHGHAELKAAKSPAKTAKGKSKSASKAAKAEQADVLTLDADKSEDTQSPRRKANAVPKVPKKK